MLAVCVMPGFRPGTGLEMYVSRWWRGQDSNLRSPSGRQIYSLVALTTHPPLHVDATFDSPSCLKHPLKEPQRGLEPLTCRLQIGCAANCATGARFSTATVTRISSRHNLKMAPTGPGPSGFRQSIKQITERPEYCQYFRMRAHRKLVWNHRDRCPSTARCDTGRIAMSWAG